MIEYKEGLLGVNPDLLLRVRGSAIPKALIFALPSAALAVGLFWYWGGGDVEAVDSVGQAWTGYSFVLGFLLVQRMQVAYDRYWEACTITNKMRGEWIDCYMNLCSFCSTAEEKHEEVMEFKGLILRLFSILHQAAISKLGAMDTTEMPILDPKGIETEYLELCMNHPNKIEMIVVWLEQAIIRAHFEGTVPVAPPVLARVFSTLSQGMVGFQDVMKLRTYATPFPIVQVIQYLIIFHAMVSPVIASLIMYTWSWAAMLSFTSVFSFWCINYIAMEIESPFDDHYNSLPFLAMQEDFNSTLLLLTTRFLWRPPKFTVTEAIRFSKGAKTMAVAESFQVAISEGQEDNFSEAPTNFFEDVEDEQDIKPAPATNSEFRI